MPLAPYGAKATSPPPPRKRIVFDFATDGTKRLFCRGDCRIAAPSRPCRVGALFAEASRRGREKRAKGVAWEGGNR